MKTWSAAGLVLAGIMVTSSAMAGQYTDQVKSQLELIRNLVEGQGWQETHDPKYDKLDKGGSDSFSFTLRQGKSYKIVSVCDNDCSDLDLILSDENGREVSRDEQKDSMPVVEATPSRTGKYTLKVKMHACNSDPCYYGITILAK